MMNVVFLDRDGTINEDVGYLHKKEDFVFCEGGVEGLRRLSECGFSFIIITNQSGIARGIYSEEEYLVFQRWIEKELRDKGINILKTYYCPHYKRGTVAKYAYDCACRKPKIGLFTQAMEEFDINESGSYVIGDRLRDLSIVNYSKIRGILVGDREKEEISADIIRCRNLDEAATQIKKMMQR